MNVIQQFRHVADQLAAIEDPVAFTLAEVCRGRAIILQHEQTEVLTLAMGNVRKPCQVYAHGDTMSCTTCSMTWDVNDFDPPKCPR